MEEAQAERKARSNQEAISPEQIERIRLREGLELSRNRVLDDLQVATNPRYQAQLRDALQFLEAKLQTLAK